MLAAPEKKNPTDWGRGGALPVPAGIVCPQNKGEYGRKPGKDWPVPASTQGLLF